MFQPNCRMLIALTVTSCVWACNNNELRDPPPVAVPATPRGAQATWNAESERDAGQPLLSDHSLHGWHVIDSHMFARHGSVTVVDGELRMEKGDPGTGVCYRLRQVPRVDYELTLEAKRIDGDDIFCALTLPFQDSYFSWVLGGWGGSVCGISNINDEPAVENETTVYVDFRQEQWYRLRIRVTKESITAWFNDEVIVDVATKGKRFDIWWEQEPARPLGITTWSTSAAVRNVRLREISAP